MLQQHSRVFPSALVRTVFVVRTTRFSHSEPVRKGAARRGGAEGAQAPPLAIRILMFIFLVFPQHCKSRSSALQNVLWQNHKQNRRQKVVHRGALRLCGGDLLSCRGAWHSILTNST